MKQVADVGTSRARSGPGDERTLSASDAHPTPPHLDFRDGSVGGVSSASSSTPVAASTTSPARWTAARWPLARSAVSYRSTGRGPTPVGYSSTAVSDQATSTGTGASAGSVRATSRTRDDVPARSPSSRATATRNPGDRPVNPAAGAAPSPASSPDAPVRTHTVSPSATPPRTTQPPARTSTRICNPDASVVTSTSPVGVRPSGAEHLRVVAPAHRTRRAGEPFIPDHRPVLVAQAVQTPRPLLSLPDTRDR